MQTQETSADMYAQPTLDPTTKDRQGNDRGTQYRSAIFAHSPEQLDIVKKVTAEVQAKVRHS